ncbi:YraN family protein [Kitasatospora sp. NPDC096147]|uniref:YraN family protein n=1 Tax=Kitasatospora sp. NPDC096147 TaxID=3364093 RepID=UPI00381AD5AB
MQSSNTGLGRYGEEVAARWLAQGGLQILERNWRCADGELDIVALDGDTLAVCEVKTRSERGFQQPQEGIDRTKADRLRRLAERWLGERWPEHFARLASAVEANAAVPDRPATGAPGAGPGAAGGRADPGGDTGGTAVSPGTVADSGRAGGGEPATGKGGRGKGAKASRAAVPSQLPLRSVPLPPGGVRIDLVAVVNRLKGAALVEHLRGAV